MLLYNSVFQRLYFFFMIVILVSLHTVFSFIALVTKPAYMALLLSVPVPEVSPEVLHVFDDHPTHQALEPFSSFLDWQPTLKHKNLSKLCT